MAVYDSYPSTGPRTKDGHAEARSHGIHIGRKKGTRNKKGFLLSPFEDMIKYHLLKGRPITRIQDELNVKLGKDIHYNTYGNFVKHLKETDKEFFDELNKLAEMRKLKLNENNGKNQLNLNQTNS